MKKPWKIAGLLLLSIFTFGFKANDIIELEGYFNARYSANFLKSTKNVKFVMPPGTKARIDEIKTFNSGNYGFKVEVSEGKHKGESVWVYYNPKSPGMKVYPSEEALAEDKPTKNLEQAKQVKTTEETPALRVPAGVDAAATELAQVESVIAKVEKTQKVLKDDMKPCDGCEVANLYARDTDKKPSGPPPEKPAATKPPAAPKEMAAKKPEPVVIDVAEKRQVVTTVAQDRATTIPIRRTQNPIGIRPTRCAYKEPNYSVCTYEGEPAPGKFGFSNIGPSKASSTRSDGRSRDWMFLHPGDARQDLGISLSDSPNGTVSRIQESYMMVFPRTTVPNIRTEGNRQIVTLANGETVSFDARTKDIVGGVFAETAGIGPATKAISPAKVAYRGQGVMVRADAVGKDPRLVRGSQATISKQGKNCRVPITDLWPDQRESSAAHFKYFSDSDFDTYLKRKCGFGL